MQFRIVPSAMQIEEDATLLAIYLASLSKNRTIEGPYAWDTPTMARVAERASQILLEAYDAIAPQFIPREGSNEKSN